jgi:hypothetical protein
LSASNSEIISLKGTTTYNRRFQDLDISKIFRKKYALLVLAGRLSPVLLTKELAFSLPLLETDIKHSFNIS